MSIDLSIVRLLSAMHINVVAGNTFLYHKMTYTAASTLHKMEKGMLSEELIAKLLLHIDCQKLPPIYVPI